MSRPSPARWAAARRPAGWTGGSRRWRGDTMIAKLFPFRSRSKPLAAGENCPLEVRGLTVAYNRKPVLWSIDYTAPPCGLIAIVGPNGAGKSTFIKACLGLVPAVAGMIH